MSDTPLISVIVNCYNGQKFLNKCINSILDQTYTNFEIIFWNNKSDDDSLLVIKKYTDKRIKIFNSKIHTNISIARNNAIKESAGDYICFLDVDDYWSKFKLEKQIIYFKSEEIGVSFTNFWYIKISKKKENKKKINLKFENGLINKLIKKYEIVLSTIMVKREVLEKIDTPFNEAYHIISDFDFTLNLLLINKYHHIKDHLTYRTWHGENETIKKRRDAVQEIENWINNNHSKYKNYLNEINFLEKKVFYDKINFKIKDKKFVEAINFFLNNSLNLKLSYIKNIFMRLIN